MRYQQKSLNGRFEVKYTIHWLPTNMFFHLHIITQIHTNKRLPIFNCNQPRCRFSTVANLHPLPIHFLADFQLYATLPPMPVAQFKLAGHCQHMPAVPRQAWDPVPATDERTTQQSCSFSVWRRDWEPSAASGWGGRVGGYSGWNMLPSGEQK